MFNTKLLAFGGILAGLAALFQLIPAVFGEGFIIFTLISALPIYMIARLDARLGTAAFFDAGVIIMLLSVHEGLFFLLTNGPVGLSLGICSFFKKGKAFSYATAALILTSTLCVLNYVIGIPVFGTELSGTIWHQVGMLFLFSIIYCVTYYHIADGIYGKFYDRYFSNNR